MPLRNSAPAVAGMLIGVGMGGFVDGIVLHQIAQWHYMLSNILPPHTVDHVRVNKTWDGLFHALAWVPRHPGARRAQAGVMVRTPASPSRPARSPGALRACMRWSATDENRLGLFPRQGP
jgi:Predicted membrane protein (DUF2243)